MVIMIYYKYYQNVEMRHIRSISLKVSTALDLTNLDLRFKVLSKKMSMLDVIVRPNNKKKE